MERLIIAARRVVRVRHVPCPFGGEHDPALMPRYLSSIGLGTRAPVHQLSYDGSPQSHASDQEGGGLPVRQSPVGKNAKTAREGSLSGTRCEAGCNAIQTLRFAHSIRQLISVWHNSMMPCLKWT